MIKREGASNKGKEKIGNGEHTVNEEAGEGKNKNSRMGEGGDKRSRSQGKCRQRGREGKGRGRVLGKAAVYPSRVLG